MCGFAGFWNRRALMEVEASAALVSRMADSMLHRGPDDQGTWVDAGAGLALGFRRLAIVDLSPEGHQPMCSASGRYALVFNGEIYNHQDLRSVLGDRHGVTFRGRSDTEVMLACFECWGVAPSLERFSGMFAFALYDRRERRLYLARDRMGEKPLYYGWMRDTFLFGSELKSLRAHPDFRGVVDRGALSLYFRHGYIPAPYTIYQGIRKLPPGSFLALNERDGEWLPEPTAYWSVKGAAEPGTRATYPGSPEEAADHLEGLLTKVIGREMVADVPLGAFLSGGIDSSTVVALMQAQSARPVRTFTIGFFETGYDEAQHAKEVARHLGTEHTEFYVTPEQARAVIPRLPAIFDEPFADSSAIPTFLVSQMARREVTVSLSGDGGDELFCGYTWYARTASLWRRLAAAPPGLRKVAAALFREGTATACDQILTLAAPVLPRSMSRHVAGGRATKLSRLLGRATSPEQLHRLLSALWESAEVVAGERFEPATPFVDVAAQADLDDPVDRLMYLDQVTYLPDDILTKVDRASMAVSLESRAPLLDHEIVEFAWRIPWHWKLRQGATKWPLRRILDRHIPRELMERPKQGFSVPIADWLRGPLKEWAESLLRAESLKAQGYLNPDPISRRWREHLQGRRDWSGSLWTVLMFQAWLDTHT